MKPITWKYYSVLAAALTMVLGPVSPAQAQFTEDTSVPSTSTDTFNWSALGTTYTDIPTPASITSEGDLSATLLNGGDSLERRDQGNGWDGSFAPGAPLIWNQEDGNNITIDFSSPVVGAGAQIEADDYGSFTAQIDLYGAAHNLLQTFTEEGDTTSADNDTTIFLGAHNVNGSADIYSISFSTPETSDVTNDFAIGNLLIGVPEPASSYGAWAGILACGLVALHRSLRKHGIQSKGVCRI